MYSKETINYFMSLMQEGREPSDPITCEMFREWKQFTLEKNKLMVKVINEARK